MSPDRQPRLHFPDIEIVTDLKTGETSLRRSKQPRDRSRSRRGSSQRERDIATARWSASCRFEILLAGGAEAYRAGEAAKIAITSGINTEFGAGIGNRDDADLALKKAFAQTRFQTIGAYDIVRQVNRTTSGLRRNLAFGSDWFEGYLDRVIDLLGEEKGLSHQKAEEYKAFIHSEKML